jgi:hypothetical protein
MGKCRTPSFILEKKLLTSRKDEEALGLRFSYAVKIQCQLVKHARKQIQKLREDGEYRALLAARASIPKGGKGRVALDQKLGEKRLSFGLSQYQFKQWVNYPRLKSRACACPAVRQRLTTPSALGCSLSPYRYGWRHVDGTVDGAPPHQDMPGTGGIIHWIPEPSGGTRFPSAGGS